MDELEGVLSGVKSAGIDIGHVVRKLDSEKDRNFLFNNELGEKFVLKIFNSATTREDVELMVAAMGVAGKALTVPRVILWGPHPMLFMVTKWVEGSTLSSLFSLNRSHHESLSVLRDIGREVGKMSVALSLLPAVPRKQRLIWNFENFRSVTVDSDFPELVKLVGPKLHELSNVNRQMCHYDMNDDNIVVSSEGMGIIDFGDVDVAPRITDLSLSICYVLINLFKEVESVDIGVLRRVVDSMVTGYREVVTDVSDHELKLCGYLVIARALMSLCIQAKSRAGNPDNATYLSVSDQGSRRMLSFVNLESKNISEFLNLFTEF
jgi:Ser/Thr protein kinase RdoA (MazF antagonist)